MFMGYKYSLQYFGIVKIVEISLSMPDMKKIGWYICQLFEFIKNIWHFKKTGKLDTKVTIVKQLFENVWLTKQKNVWGTHKNLLRVRVSVKG